MTVGTKPRLSFDLAVFFLIVLSMAIGDKIVVNDKMQTGYFYELAAPVGDDFHTEFKPFYEPKEMLEMGVFEGKYCNDCTKEFPKDWFENAKTNATADVNLNFFAIKSRQPMSVWLQKDCT